jgi:RNA polymerase sigma-70 factor (ECF subfamily)
MEQLLTADAPPVGESCAQTQVTSSKGSGQGSRDGGPAMRRPSLERPGDRRADAAAVLTRIQHDAEDDAAARAIVARVQAGDDVAFAELYVRYFGRVERYLTIALKNPDDAQEAAQDVFLKVLKSLDRYEQRSEPFGRWLFRVVRNHALDCQKRQWRTEATDPHVLNRRNLPVPTDDEDAAASVGALIATLSTDQQRVMTLLYVYGFDVGDAADVLGKTPDAVRHLHMRALRAVGAALPAEKRRHFPRVAEALLAPLITLCTAVAAYSDELVSTATALC